MRDIFDPLFDSQDLRLKSLGNPFEELREVINWELFRPTLNKVHSKERKSAAGAKHKDVVMMFKALVIQDLFGLSDDQLEYQIEDRRSFQRFLGLNKHERSPDAKTFWLFKERLTKGDLIKELFTDFHHQLNCSGYIARKGQIVDASIVPAPIQRNSRDENQQIKAGDVPADWSENKKRQKDTEACWTKKHGKSYFGYKNHIQVDNDKKLIRDYEVTDASVHDSQVFEPLLDPSNTNRDVWADSAYRSKETEEWLKEEGYRSKIQRKGKRNQPLSKHEQQGNRTRSKTRSRVEHIFADQRKLRTKAIRCIGIARSTLQIGLMNLSYNMRRFCFLKRVSVP